MSRIHLIAIGGSAMHNLALALHEKGHTISGSDDEINEPSKSRLHKAGLLPERTGWFPEKIGRDIDAIVLGMHAREDNPELVRAKELGLKIYSYPEYIYEATRDKIRIVIGGSHGKTSVTSMILHVMKHCGIAVDYLVGAQLEGFQTMVSLTKDAKYAVIEGDEYLASPIDRRPKFHLYKPHIAILTGVAWDHINVFPTFENYVEQFREFIRLIQPGGTLIYCKEDEVLAKLCAEKVNPEIEYVPYSNPRHRIEGGVTSLVGKTGETKLQVFGDHNLLNVEGSRLVCEKTDVSEEQFLRAIARFKGAAKRLEPVLISGTFSFYKDFAHSPSKVKATVRAVKKQFPERDITACLELHTFSSLNEAFLQQYHGSMDECDNAAVYFNPHTIAHKKLKAIEAETVVNSFGRSDLTVFTSSGEMIAWLKGFSLSDRVLLMMSSGNFDGIDFNLLANEISGQKKS